MSKASNLPVPKINGVSLFNLGEVLDQDGQNEKAYTELLRQEAVRLGKIPSVVCDVAPNVTAADRQMIETMLDELVPTPVPSTAECQRYYDSHQQALAVGQSRKIRHILFAVTQGVNVTALAQRAEVALLELKQAKIASDDGLGKFAQLAAELSNCPSGANGGELGWLTPQDCASELAKELFFNQASSEALGLMPRLIHTRHGFHIIDVQELKLGQLPEFSVLEAPIRLRLQAQSKATALRQFMRLLVGRSAIEGMELEGATSDLVQ